LGGSAGNDGTAVIERLLGSPGCAWLTDRDRDL